MRDYELTEATFTKKMKEEAKGIMSWLRDDYKENKKKIGRMKAQAEFEEYRECQSHIDENGKKWFTCKPDLTKPVKYECILYIYVPLTGMSFKATDRHKYRWNVRRSEFDFEETEIL